jgi:ligand-binding sensor domain-containing protein
MTKLLSPFFLFIFISGDLYSKDLNLTHLSVKDGLSSSTVYYAMQDSKGFIWFCTETGVDRYDGRIFEKFTINNGLADNEIFKCFEDSKNRIWFLSYNGKLSFFFRGKIYNDANTPWLAYPYIGAFLLNCKETKNGDLYISTSCGSVLLIKNNRVKVMTAPFPERQSNHSFITANLFFENDSLKKFSEHNSDLYKYNLFNETIVSLGSTSVLLKQNDAKDFAEFFGNKNAHPFLKEGILVNYDQVKGFTRLNTHESRIKSNILSFLRDKNTCWLGTTGDGAFGVTEDSVLYEEKELQLLPGMTVSCIMKDREENIWFATHGNGVFILKDNARSITTIPSGSTYSVRVFLYRGAKTIITGDDKGNLRLIRGDSIFKSFHLSDGKFDRIRDIFPISDTEILAGTDMALIYKGNIAANKWTPLNKNQGYKNGTLSPDGSFWVCTQDIIYKSAGNSLRPVYYSSALGKCTAIAILADSAYYVGTTGMLYKVIEHGAIKKVILGYSTLKTGINDLKLVNGMLWVSTHGNGIFILKNDSVYKHIDTKDCGIVSDVCQKLYDDGKNYVWLATNQGISVLNRENGNLFCNLSSSTGMTSDDIKNITTDSDNVYAATAEGINIFKLKNILTNLPPPKVYVTSFKKGNQTIVDPDSAVVFDYFNGFVNFYFTAITYQSPGNVQYEYKLGSTTDWQPTRTTNISLFSLSPGTHQLFVRAKKYNSDWSDPVILSIIVIPLWYQTIWFYTLVAIVAISFVYHLVHRRIKGIRIRSGEQNMLHQKITELENKSLAYQMNPHFIFNSLNTVQQFMLTKEPHQGIRYLSDFAILMRKMLENSRQAAIPLSDEIDFLRYYLQLEKIRFTDKFEYFINVDKKLLEDEIAIPPILFQPLLENAIKHGIAPVGKGKVTLTVIRENDFLIGIVEDNGIGIYSSCNESGDIEEKKESTALKVLEERLKLIRNKKGQNGCMTITDKRNLNSAEKGTIVEIRIPITE